MGTEFCDSQCTTTLEAEVFSCLVENVGAIEQSTGKRHRRRPSDARLGFIDDLAAFVLKSYVLKAGTAKTHRDEDIQMGIP
jgi:hypothetical protein